MDRRTRASRYRHLRRLADGPNSGLTILHARKLLADHPDCGPAWQLVGTALIGLARYDEAEQALSRAIELCPPEKRQYPLAQMGHLFRESGDYNRSVDWHRRAVEADPCDATFHIFLGAVLAKAGRFAEAEEVHRAATACPDGCIDEAYLNLGLVLRAGERFAEAAECFREALRIDPEYKHARRALRDVRRCITCRIEGN